MKDYVWFVEHCKTVGVKKGVLLNQWLKKYRVETEGLGQDDLYRCKCGFLVSGAEFQKLFMKCPKCGGINTMELLGGEQAPVVNPGLDAVLQAKRVEPIPPAPPAGEVVGLDVALAAVSVDDPEVVGP